MHAIKSRGRQTAQKDRGGIYPSSSPPPAPFSFPCHLSVFLSLFLGRRGHPRVPRHFRRGTGFSEDARSQHMVPKFACRGYGAETSSSPGGARTFCVHPTLLPSTFFSAPHTPSPVPFRHNNRAVSQRVFNGRRLHATRLQAGPLLPHLYPSLSFFLFLFLSFILSLCLLSLCLSLFHARFSDSTSLSSSSSRIFPLSWSLSLPLSLLVLWRDVRPFSIPAKTRGDHVSRENTRKQFCFSTSGSCVGVRIRELRRL